MPTDTGLSAEAFAAESGTLPNTSVSNTTSTTSSINTPNLKFYTEEDLGKARSQEKEKLYPILEELKGKVSTLEKERADEQARIAAEIAAKEAEAQAKLKAQQEADTETRELLLQKEKDLLAQIDAERQERLKSAALLERERQFNELVSYKARRVEEVRESIIPDLVDLISGSTVEEIEQSIAGLQDRTSRILESVAQASQTARRDMVGTRPTLPAAGPLETNSEQRSFSPQEIADMSLSDYAKVRSRLLSDTARGVTNGLFG